MGVWSVLFMSAMPVFRLLVHCGIGAYLSSPQSNVMPAEARKHINKLVFVCFMPSLIFSNLAQTVTVEKMLDWWFMPINVFLCYLIGAGIGECIYDHFKPPPHLRRLIVACCATGNSSNLPLVLVSAICVEAGSPFGRYDVCTANGIAYISYGLWMSTVLTWTVVFNYLKPKEQAGELTQGNERSDQISHEDDDAGQSSGQQPLALLASKDFSAFQGPQGFAPGFDGSQEFQGPQGFLNSQAPPGFSGGFRDSGMFAGPQDFQPGGFPTGQQGYQPGLQGFPGPRGGFQNLHVFPPQGFQQGPQPFPARGPQGFQALQAPGPQGFQTGPRNSMGYDDYDDGSQGFSGLQSYQSYPNPSGFQLQPQGYNQGFQVNPGFQGPQTFPTPSPPPQVFPSAAPQAGTSRSVQEEHELHSLTDDFSLANLQLWAEKYHLKEAFTPPTAAAAIAIPIGAVPFFRHLLYGHEAPFRFFGDALVILGEAMIPCMNLLLGGNLSQGFGASELALEVVVCIMLTRLVLLPIAGLIVVKLAFSMGLVPADPLFHFVLLLQFTMPTAINVGTMTQLFGVGQTECSIILFWCYTSSIVFLTLWTMLFVVLLI